MDLLNKLSSDAEQVFGHRVIYFVTDPDKRGQDHTMHEYQLYNVVCEGNIKVSVDGNNFPDSQIVMNQFDLSLFESMSVHITKSQFKEIFGPQRRPSKEDFLYFCDVNRMFQVDHAQQFRNFNNSAVYYKLVLKKYTQKANVKAGNQEINNKLQQLTKNSTINELFGIENAQDKASIANKDQFAPLTKETIRLEYNATIDKELIENSTTIISKAHYDLSSVNYGEVAVKYKNFDRVIDNIPVLLTIGVDVHCIICGEGNCETQLKSQAERLRIDKRVHFAGYVRERDLAGYYAACDIFAMLNSDNYEDATTDNFGVVYLEAGYFGKPVIASRLGSVLDAVHHEENGLLVNQDSGYEVLQTFNRMCQDSQLREKLGRQGKELAKRKNYHRWLYTPESSYSCLLN
jgi:glycosyltransferase involved in cell wall biosynthesis